VNAYNNSDFIGSDFGIWIFGIWIWISWWLHFYSSADSSGYNSPGLGY